MCNSEGEGPQMNDMTKLLLITFSAVFSLYTLALDGPGITGGGEGEQNKSGSISLSDLVQGDCTWTSGVKFGERMDFFERYAFLDKTDPELYLQLSKDLFNLNVCEQDLPLNAQSLPALKVPLTEYKNLQKLVAVRVENSLYIDTNNLTILPADQNPTFLLHELLHAQIQGGIDHTIRLKSFVKFLATINVETSSVNYKTQKKFAKLIEIERDSKFTNPLCFAAQALSESWIAALLKTGHKLNESCGEQSNAFLELIGASTKGEQAGEDFSLLQNVFSDPFLEKGIDWSSADDSTPFAVNFFTPSENLVMAVVREHGQKLRPILHKAITSGAYKMGKWPKDISVDTPNHFLFSFPRYPILSGILAIADSDAHAEQEVQLGFGLAAAIRKARAEDKKREIENIVFAVKLIPSMEEKKAACMLAKKYKISELQNSLLNIGISCTIQKK